MMDMDALGLGKFEASFFVQEEYVKKDQTREKWRFVLWEHHKRKSEEVMAEFVSFSSIWQDTEF